MNIRPATIADMDRLEQMDASYATEYVWQMDERIAAEELSLRFQRMHLPRQTEVTYPLDAGALYSDWQRSDCFLVAQEFITPLGYIDMVVNRFRWQGWIEHLVVDRPYRGQGVATQLSAAAERWARGSELTSMTVAIQSKNDAAVRFFQGRGYTFRGAIDHYYSNGDITLLFALDL